MNRLMLTTAVVGLMGGWTGAAAAQTAMSGGSVAQLDEVVVTARRREENLQQVPVAVTTLTQGQINNQGSFRINDLERSVPSLTFTNSVGTRSDVVPTLRGQSRVFGGRYPSTMTYFSEVPILKITNGQFYDLENIQVLRGPQGTLFGRVTDGGNLMITPRKPTNDFSGFIQGRFGDYSLRDFVGAVNVPIFKGKLLARVAFDINRRDGFTRNLLPGVDKDSSDLDNVHYNSFRFSLVARPTDQFENYTVVAYKEANENGFGNQIVQVNPTIIAGTVNGLASAFGLGSQVPAFGNGVAAQMQAAILAQRASGIRTTSAGSLLFGSNAGLYNKRQDTYVINRTTFGVNDNLTLKNILGYVRIKNHWGADFDGSPLLYIDTENVNLPHPEFNLEQVSEEFQVEGKAFDGKLNYTVGAYGTSSTTRLLPRTRPSTSSCCIARTSSHSRRAARRSTARRPTTSAICFPASSSTSACATPKTARRAPTPRFSRRSSRSLAWAWGPIPTGSAPRPASPGCRPARSAGARCSGRSPTPRPTLRA